MSAKLMEFIKFALLSLCSIYLLVYGISIQSTDKIGCQVMCVGALVLGLVASESIKYAMEEKR